MTPSWSKTAWAVRNGTTTVRPNVPTDGPVPSQDPDHAVVGGRAGALDGQLGAEGEAVLVGESLRDERARFVQAEQPEALGQGAGRGPAAPSPGPRRRS